MNLTITFEAEGIEAQSIVVGCPHGLPQQLACALNEEGTEDLFDFIRVEIRAGNFSFARKRFRQDALIPARKELLIGD